MKKLFCILSLFIFAGSAFAGEGKKELNRKPSSTKQCTFSYSAGNWTIAIPTDSGVQGTSGTLEQMAQAAFHLNQAKVCAF